MNSIRHRRIFAYDSKIGYRFVPDLKLFWDYRIKTNHEGFRSNYNFSEAPDNGFRMLALGDSFLAGDGVANDERFSNILEKKLGISVFNTGLPGSGTDQQLLIQEHVGTQLPHDAVLFAPFLHDIMRNMSDRVHWTRGEVSLFKPYFTLQNEQLTQHNVQVPAPELKEIVPEPEKSGLYEKLPEPAKDILRWAKSTSLSMGIKLANSTTDKYFSDPSSPEWTLMKALSRKIVENADGKPVIIVPMPDREHTLYKYRPHYLERYKEFAKEFKNVTVVDILPVFHDMTYKDHGRAYNAIHGHFTPEINTRIAALLEKELKPLLNRTTPVTKADSGPKPTYVIGLSCYYHDSAAAILKDGEILAAAHEERFTRKKHDKRFPFNALRYCLEEADIRIEDTDAVVYYDDSLLSLDRVLINSLAKQTDTDADWADQLVRWVRTKFALQDDLKKCCGYTGSIQRSYHHRSHAASAFYPSPFKEAAIVVVDGVGEWASSSIGVGEGNGIRILKEQHYPHSIGLLYSAFTAFCGFKVNSGEYKLMGLAPYGEPLYSDLIRKHMLTLHEDGSFQLNMEYFSFMDGETMYSQKFAELFGIEARTSESPLTQKYMDIARSVQDVTETIMLHIAAHAHAITQKDYLVMAGGVALNCVANGKLLKKSPFKDIWIQPASGDAGGAIGAAMDYHYNNLNKERISIVGTDNQPGSLYGPAYSNTEIKSFLEWFGYPHHHLGNSKYETIAGLIAEGKVIGFFTGRMEYGPRALGARSIIADARNTKMQSVLNLKIKYRESFRPFAPIVLEEDVSEYFDLDRPSPYMLMVQGVQEKRRNKIPDELKTEENFIKKLNFPRSDIPAVTHLDYSARIQTVNSNQNPSLYKLLRAFKDKTGYGVLVNTSFNVRGEPIVMTPEDAFRCFMRTEMDVLVLEDYILYKKEQKPLSKDSDWKNEFELD